MQLRIRSLTTFGLLALLSVDAVADRVLTEDGRIITPLKAREEGEGYRLTFENGEIVLPNKAGIASVEIEGNMDDYVPQNEKEKKFLEEGRVKYRGKWWSKPAYESQLKKEFEASKKRTEELAVHANFENPWTKETKHFFIKTNTTPELLEYYAKLLESYYSLMNKRIGIKPTPKYRKLKMTVNIYKSREEFHTWSNEVQGAGIGPGVAGYFWSADNTLNFYHDYQEPAVSDWVALHECTHLLTFLIDQQYVSQIWVNEAVADYFGSSDLETDKRGKITIKPGKLQTDRVLTVQQAIKDGNDIPLEKLFKITRDEFHAFQYAHAWSFVYFLNNYDKGKYSKGFARFFRDLYTLKGVEYDSVPAAGMTGTGKKVSPENIRAFLLKKIGEKDTAKLEKQWKEFIAAIPVEGPAARLKRGIRAVYQFNFEEALPDLDAAIEAGIEDPRAFWGRGRALAFSGKRAEAVKDLAKAVEMDPLNAGFRFELSRVMSRSLGGVGGITIDMGSDDLKDADAKMHAGLALELDPENESYREWFSKFE